MAPEQWSDAARADGSSDIYSLAILAYKCLTGNEPFTGKNLRTLARAHASLPLPPLPPSLPQELLPVLQKGAAKDPAARYASPGDFADALRAAAGLEREPPSLPELDEGLRENVFGQSPQPIAEAVALMSSARTVRMAVEAAAMVRTVVCRYLAVISIAARSRIGSGSASESPRVAELVSKLFKESLSDAEWLSLSALIVKPFAHRRNAHVMPELIRVFYSEQGGEQNALSALVEPLWPAKEAAESEQLEFLKRFMPVLGRALERLSFLTDYPLVVQQQDSERWMGARRPKRVAHFLTSKLNRDDVVLVDAVGAVAVTLSPLVQCSAPSGGAPDELFFIDGAGRHGARLVSLPAPFERQDEDLRAWFVSQQLLPASANDSVAQEAAPYKGLSAFTTEDADNYFGREREAEGFANRLRQQPFLAVVGPSGTGKSSFVLAGVLPLLPKGWRAVTLRPGATPLEALAARLSAESLPSLSNLESFAAAVGDDQVLVIVVDQFEELVTLCPEVAAREAFAHHLVAAANHHSGRVKVVLTLRDDFLIRVQQLSAFRQVLSSSLQLLGTPAPEELQRVVTEPARRVGYAFDDPTLPRRMVEAVADYSGALALLSFTASQLWDLRDRHLRLMRVKTYDALGGVAGALANHAELTLNQMSPADQKLVREAFRHLVTAQGTRAVLSKKEAMEVLGDTENASRVLTSLIGARLLVSSETPDGQDSIEIIHEALTIAWPRLVAWQREDAESARLRDSLRASARQWAERGQPSGLLWRKETLAEYRAWRARFAGRLTQLEEAFARASLRDESRARTIRGALATIAFVVLAIGLVVVFRAYRVADASANEAKQRLADMRVEQARLAALDDKPFHTLLYADEARRLGAKGSQIDYLEKRAQTKLAGQVASRDLKEGSRLIANADNTVLAAVGINDTLQLLSLPKLELLAEVTGGGNQQAFAFLPDGKSGLLCQQRSIVLVKPGSPPRELASFISPQLRGCAFTSKGMLLAANDTAGVLHTWRYTETGLDQHRTLELKHNAIQLLFSPDGRRLLLFLGPQANFSPEMAYAPFVDVGEPLRLISKLSSGIEATLAAAFSPDGLVVATAGVDGIARRFSTEDGHLLGLIQGHSAAINDIEFSSDSQTFLTSSADGTARLWDSKGDPKGSAFAHGAGVVRARPQDAEHVLTATTDGRVSLWLANTTAPLFSLFGHVTRITGFEIVGPGLIATSASDGMLRVWDLNLAAAKQLMTGEELTFALPSEDERWMLTGPDFGKFSRWKLPSLERLDEMQIENCTPMLMLAMNRQDPPVVATAEGASVCVAEWRANSHVTRLQHNADSIRKLVWSADDRLLAVASGDKTVTIWNVKAKSEARVIEQGPLPRGIAFSNSGARLAITTRDGVVHMWSWEEGRQLSEWQAHGSPIRNLSFSRSDRFVLTVAEDQQIALWDSSSGTLIKRLVGHTAVVGTAALNASETLVASSDSGGNVFVWDIDSGRSIDLIRVGGAAGVRWLNDGRLVVSLANRRAVNVYAASGSELNWRCQNPLKWVDGSIVTRGVGENCSPPTPR